MAWLEEGLQKVDLCVFVMSTDEGPQEVEFSSEVDSVVRLH